MIHIDNLALALDESPEDLYQKLMALIEDSLTWYDPLFYFRHLRRCNAQLRNV